MLVLFLLKKIIIVKTSPSNLVRATQKTEIFLNFIEAVPYCTAGKILLKIWNSPNEKVQNIEEDYILIMSRLSSIVFFGWVR